MVSAVICPACHSRNKPSWEYCVRCGESLEEASAEATRAAEARPRVEEGGGPQDLSSLYLVLMLAILLSVVAAACHSIANSPPPPPATPGPFTFGGSVPPSPPAVQATPKPGAADGEAGRRLLAQRKAAEAIPLLERAAADDPGNAEFRQLLGRALWETGDRDGALRRYSEAARMEPARYRLGYAQSLEIAGQLEAAVAEFEGVYAAQPGSTITREGLARLYFLRGDYAKALPLLQQTVAETHDLAVMQQVAYALDKTGDRDGAAEAYRRMLAVEPRADVARSLLAENLFVQGRKDEALAVLQEGLQRSPETPLLQRKLGVILERSGRNAEAAAAYREYARLAPNAPDAAELTARAARLAGSGS